MSLTLKWLNNRGANLVRATGRRGRNGVLLRYEPPDGSLSIPEAAVVLATNQQKLRRLAGAGLLELRTVHGRPMVPLTEIRRLQTDSNGLADRRRSHQRGAA